MATREHKDDSEKISRSTIMSYNFKFRSNFRKKGHVSQSKNNFMMYLLQNCQLYVIYNLPHKVHLPDLALNPMF